MLELLKRVSEPKFKYLWRTFGDDPFRLLDVGVGNHSASRTKKCFPNCEYYGVDSSRDYNNDDVDFALMREFWEMDVSRLRFEAIPSDFFDALVMNHVIEHLPNGDRVLAGLIPKLKRGGVVYIEYPGFRSVRLPSMPGTLNFFDDPTHCRIYSLPELYNILLDNGCRPIAGGTRREWLRVLLTPAFLVFRRITEGRFLACDVWDLLGFAEFVFARHVA